MTISFRMLPVLVVLAFVNSAFAVQKDSIALDTLGMEISPQEKAAIERAMALGPKISSAAEEINGPPYRRDAHAKATGCVRATFSISGSIPERFRYSVFKQPGREYKAWVRFSNGDMVVQSDVKPDARGMAIKLMGVDGEKIAPELLGANTQDFVMTNTPAFFHRNIFDYVEDMEYLAKLERTRWFISVWPPRLHPLRFYRAIETVSTKISSPFSAQYYSMTPYALHDTPLKFSARPCAGMQPKSAQDPHAENYLTDAMEAQLQTGAACFDFLIQEKIPGHHMPIDDATVIWSQSASPWRPIARLNIPPQQFGSEEQTSFCENLSMNPWHGVGRWRPLGSLNRSRRLVYHAVSKFRHGKNATQSVEPINWCFKGEEDCELSAYFHKSKSKWPLPRYFDSHYLKADASAGFEKAPVTSSSDSSGR